MDTDIDTTTALDVARDAGLRGTVKTIPNFDDKAVAWSDAFVQPDAPQPPAQPERRCDGCRHWERPHKRAIERRGVCRLPYEVDSPIDMYAVWCEDGPELLTPADWFCKGFEARKETKDNGD